MSLRDLLELSFGNLRRMKLRAFLTISGVVIAIAAFVSMVSFGAGAQQNVAQEYEKLGLFSTVQVYPAGADDLPDSVEAQPLNDHAVARLQELPGVKLAYPLASFSAEATLGERHSTIEAQALPAAALATKVFSQFKVGTGFDSDTARQVIVTDRFLDKLEFDTAETLLNRKLVLAVRSNSIDSGVVAVFRDPESSIVDRLEQLDIDSLIDDNEYRSRALVQELSSAVKRFAGGYFNSPEITADTFTIVGVMERPEAGRLHIKPVILPVGPAQRLTAGQTGPSPAELIAMLEGGGEVSLFDDDDASSETYSSITLDIDRRTMYEPLADSIRALGYRPFSFAEQFAEIQKFFFYFDMALGVIGLIALITASLGIVNTMVMSITERRKEIGILKSLGADEGTIRKQFLVESSVIGSVGAAVGIAFGWVITRIASLVVQKVAEREGVYDLELFALPLWLIAIAFLFGFVVSLVAGLYPAARAARVDPVEALRDE